MAATAPELLWLDDMDPFAAECDSDLDVLEQDCLHVLEQEVGSNPDDPERGVGIATFSSKQLQQNGQGLTTKSESDLQKDDRVDSATATVVVDPNTGDVSMNVAIAVDDGVLNVSAQSGGV